MAANTATTCGSSLSGILIRCLCRFWTGRCRWHNTSRAMVRSFGYCLSGKRYNSIAS